MISSKRKGKGKGKGNGNGNGKARYTQDIGETDIGPSKHREHLLQRTQMDEPVLGDSAIPFEIIWNHIEQHCFNERNIQILH
jgi:hypothetical protein